MSELCFIKQMRVKSALGLKSDPAVWTLRKVIESSKLSQIWYKYNPSHPIDIHG